MASKRVIDLLVCSAFYLLLRQSHYFLAPYMHRKELFVALCSGFYLESLFIKMFSLAQTLLLLPGRSPQLPPSLLLFELKLFP